MKVESTQRNNMINIYMKQRQDYKAEVVNNLPKDKITISEDAKYLSKITSEDENIDINKINEIRNKIKSGTYVVDSRKVAEKIMESIKGE